jgi:anaerobic selenocysteine-containing dehydrogenase
MTYQQIIHKVPCPTCGAARGTACGTGAGRFRQEAHDERAAKARGAMRASGNAISKWLANLGLKR